MRWDGLFADLEGQLAAEERRELDSEVAERTRRERALVDLGARLAASEGDVNVALDAGERVTGSVADLGADWVLIRTGAGTGIRTFTGSGTGTGAIADPGTGSLEVLVPLGAIVSISGLGGQSAQSRTARRFGLGYALRALSRDRTTVAVALREGPSVIGTIDAVGADHLDLAEHHEGEARRRANVRRTLTLPFSALVSVQSRR